MTIHINIYNTLYMFRATLDISGPDTTKLDTCITPSIRLQLPSDIRLRFIERSCTDHRHVRFDIFDLNISFWALVQVLDSIFFPHNIFALGKNCESILDSGVPRPTCSASPYRIPASPSDIPGPPMLKSDDFSKTRDCRAACPLKESPIELIP